MVVAGWGCGLSIGNSCGGAGVVVPRAVVGRLLGRGVILYPEHVVLHPEVLFCTQVPGVGSTFRVYFPKKSDVVNAPSKTDDGAKSQDSKQTI